MTLELANDRQGPDPDPAEEALRREEESLIWETLSDIPPTYREPLILYYRQDQSVADVAAGLALSDDAVEQRLSRGRALLRDRLADLGTDGDPSEGQATRARRPCVGLWERRPGAWSVASTEAAFNDSVCPC